jgi:quercetin dioxygenase-like cupin family protein
MYERHLLVLTMSAGLAIGLLAGTKLTAQTRSAEPAPIKRTELVRGDLTDVEGKEAVMYLFEIAPGGVGAKHFHPGTELFYVVEGSILVEPDGGSPMTVRAGEAAYNPYKKAHTARNASTTEQTKGVACLVTDKGQPLAVPTN